MSGPSTFVVSPPPVSAANMPVSPAFQINKTWTAGSSNAIAKGSIGYVTNSTTASFSLSAGTGVSQNDPGNANIKGDSALTIEFDGRFNPTDPSFGPIATGFVSVGVAGTVGTGGKAKFTGVIDFLNANTNALLRPQVVFSQPFTTAGAFSQIFTSNQPLLAGTVPLGVPMRVKGYFKFTASNDGGPTDISPLFIDAGGGAPTATWFSNAGGNWSNPINWDPAAFFNHMLDPGSTDLPTVPNGIGQIARFVRGAFAVPIDANLNIPITLGALTADAGQSVLMPAGGAPLTFDVQGGEAVLRAGNINGSGGIAQFVGVSVPVFLADPLIVQVDGVEGGGPGFSSTVSIAGQISQQGAPRPIFKEGNGTLILSHPANTYSGGTVIKGGFVDATAPGSLGTGLVLAEDGQLNYKSQGAEGSGIIITAQNNGQIGIGSLIVTPGHTLALNDLGAISGNNSVLAALTVGTSLLIAQGAMIAHENVPSVEPAGVAGLSPTLVYGVATSVTTVGLPFSLNVGSGSSGPWIGFGGDRGTRVFGDSPSGNTYSITYQGGGDLDSLHNSLTLNAQLNSIGFATLTKRGGGEVIINNVNNNFTGAVTVNAGTLTLNGALPNVFNLSVNSGATLNLNSGALLPNASISLLGGTMNIPANGSILLQAGSISFFSNAVLDLADNDMRQRFGNYSTIAARIASARNGGDWSGPGITSSLARATGSLATTLGVMSGTDYIAINGPGATFDGAAVAATDVLVKYTWAGDSDFNGSVDFDDYVRIDAGYNGALGGWLNGDFDLNGGVDFDDYVVIDYAYNFQNGTLLDAMNWLHGDGSSNPDSPGMQMVMQHVEQFGDAYISAFLGGNIPEPTSALLLLGALPMIRRRRQR